MSMPHLAHATAPHLPLGNEGGGIGGFSGS
jgi:hypothetical protein